MPAPALPRFSFGVGDRFAHEAAAQLAAFEKLAAGMNAGQREELKAAWPAMRTAQQLSARQRTAEALKQAETMGQSQRQGLSLK